jgi:hypothetical protein
VQDVYRTVKDHFADHEAVTVATGRGAQGLKYGKKMFVMFFKGDLLLKLPPQRVQALIAEGLGAPYDPGTGTPMEDRVLIGADHADSWIGLCEEALSYSSGR